MALPLLPSVAGTPFTVLPATMLAMGVEGVPATALPAGEPGMMLPLIVTVSVAVAQLGGVLLSHNW